MISEHEAELTAEAGVNVSTGDNRPPGPLTLVIVESVITSTPAVSSVSFMSRYEPSPTTQDVVISSTTSQASVSHPCARFGAIWLAPILVLIFWF